ncbi:MAG: hypothetical protein ABIP21_05140 [Acidimicrobiia bacterium]
MNGGTATIIIQFVETWMTVGCNQSPHLREFPYTCLADGNVDYG